VAPEPPPEQVVLTAGLVEYLVRKSNEHNRPIIMCWLAGYTANEISKSTGRSERTVRRIFERVRDLLCRIEAEAERDGGAM